MNFIGCNEEMVDETLVEDWWNVGFFGVQLPGANHFGMEWPDRPRSGGRVAQRQDAVPCAFLSVPHLASYRAGTEIGGIPTRMTELSRDR